ncbi:MAG: HNH endonuclease, partial [Candidatus Cryptobacteroides sp.]
VEVEAFSGRCERCGRTTWQGFDIPLEVHHINGDNKDDRIENLSILCPNCQALTDSHRGKNNKSATRETL